MFVKCQWPNMPSLGSIGQVEYEIQQKCAVCMCSSGLNLPGEKHFGIRDPSFQVSAQWPMLSWGCSMGWVVGSASATPSSLPYGSDPSKWGIVLVHLVLATHSANFSMISFIGKKLIL